MTYQDASGALAAERFSGNLEKIRTIVEAYHRDAGSSNLWEHSSLLLQACDVLSSHDFGDHASQAELLRTYAQQALLGSGLASIERELRLLAHLLHDFEDNNSGQPWPVKRFARAQRWLRALKVLAQDTRDFDSASLPAIKTPAPVEDLPTGVAAHHVKDLEIRTRYRQALDNTRHNADRFAFQWRMRQLLHTYEPLATRYIAGAYAQAPYKLGELKRLLEDYPAAEEQPSKKPSEEVPQRQQNPRPELRSETDSRTSASRLGDQRKRAPKGTASRKAPARSKKKRKR
jgi:hypothetical protein